MRKIFILFSALAVTVLYSGLYAQSGHATHHPDQQATTQSDTSNMMGKRCPMCGQMMKGGMMSGKGMMQGGMMQGGMMQGGMMQGGMMKGGMMGMMHGQSMGHMDSPMMSAVMPVLHHLPDMQTKLGLSDDQLNRIKSIRADFKKKQIDRKAEIEKTNIDLKAQVDKNADTKDVSRTLEKISKLQTQIQVESYATAQKLLSILNADQRKKWDELGPMKCGAGQMKSDQHKMMMK